MDIIGKEEQFTGTKRGKFFPKSVNTKTGEPIIKIEEEMPQGVKALKASIDQLTPVLDSLGLDLDWRREFIMKAGLQATKGKLDLISLLNNSTPEKKRTGFQRFWVGMKEGIPVIFFVWFLTITTVAMFFMIKKWFG
jgi:hypothetical protein